MGQGVVGNQAALGEHQAPPGESCREIHIVGADHQGNARLRQLIQGLLQPGHVFRIQGGGGFVQQDEIRLHGKNIRDGHPFLFSAGQKLGRALGVVMQAHGGKRLAGSLFDFPEGKSQIHGAEGYLALYGYGKDLILRFLKYDAHPAAELQKVLFLMGDRLSVTEQFSFPGLQNAVAQQKKGGFSGAVAAQNRNPFPFPDGNGQVFHGHGAVRIGIAYVFQLNNGCVHHSNPFRKTMKPTSTST